MQDPYIDAMAKFRRDALLQLGGYDNQLSQIGWFWLRRLRHVAAFRAEELSSRFRSNNPLSLASSSNLDAQHDELVRN